MDLSRRTFLGTLAAGTIVPAMPIVAAKTENVTAMQSNLVHISDADGQGIAVKTVSDLSIIPIAPNGGWICLDDSGQARNALRSL